jgi:hypothetical protein
VNLSGAMIAICDVKEYRSVCGRSGGGGAHAQFDALHALCNLLLVKPENLHQVCEGETLVCISIGLGISNKYGSVAWNKFLMKSVTTLK